jgi:RNA polymerase sigma factor (sigma-70 family)
VENKEPASVDVHQDASDSRRLEPFDLFYARERASMVALAYAISGNRLAAEDLAQEAFVVAYRQWDRVGLLDNPATWVRRVVANRSVSSLRRRAAEARALARLQGRAESSLLADVSLDAHHVWGIVRGLSKRQQQVIALRYQSGLSLAEIAEVLECSKETVYTHLRRAREVVAAQLKLEGSDG